MKAELDWFEFETKMRIVVTSLLQPLIDNLNDHSNEIESINRNLSSQSKRITSIENITGTPDKKTGWILETENRLNDLSLSIKLLANTFTEKSAETDQQLTSTQVSLKQSASAIEQIETHQELFEKDIEMLQTTIHDIHNKLNLSFESVHNDFSKGLTDLKSKTQDFYKQVEQCINKTSDLTQKTNENFNHLDKLRLIMRDQSMQMIQLVHEKATVDEFLKLTTSVDTRVEGSLEKMRKLENKFQEMVRYLDIYLPFDIQVHVSDNLYSFLNKKMLKLWMKFEEQRRKELQKKATDFEKISQVEDVLQKTLDSIKSFENRKDDIYFKMIRRRVEEEEEKDSAEITKSLTMKNDKRNLPVIDQESLSDLQQSKKEIYSLVSSLKEAKTSQENLKAFVLNEVQELKVSFKVFQDLCQAARAEDAESLSKDLKFTSDRVESFRQKLKDSYDAIMNIADLLSALSEFSIVIHGVLDQEEKEKKEVIKQTSEISLPPLHSRKASLAPNEYLSGKGLLSKPSALSIPSVLRYRNTLYSREELLEVIGKVLAKAWSEASAKLPFSFSKSSKKPNKSLIVSSPKV